MCLYVVQPVLPAAEEPCIPSQAVMEARCLSVCLMLIINSLTQSSSDFLSFSLLSDSLLWEDLWRNGLSVLQTSGSVSRMRLTNWIPHMSFCLEEGGDVVGCEGREVIPPCSLNKLHDTADMILQLPAIESGIPRVMEGRGFPWKKKKNCPNEGAIEKSQCISISCDCFLQSDRSLYIYIHELVPGETLWSWWLFFFCVRGRKGYVYSTGLLQEEAEVWWLECAGRDLQLVMITWWMLRAWGQLCVRGEQERKAAVVRMSQCTVLWKTETDFAVWSGSHGNEIFLRSFSMCCAWPLDVW